MPTPTATFTNPSTGTTYRLVAEVGGWRITKSRHDEGRLRLAHLRGSVGAGAADTAAVGRLVAGEGGAVAQPADPMVSFAAVVLCDLERTADFLTVIAKNSHDVCETGCRGFRPRSPVLRRQRDDALAKAVAECRAMAQAWRLSGLTAAALPDWLMAAMAE